MMKKMLALGALGCFLFSGVTNAAFYRVDFNGGVMDGTYNGFFTYEDTGLDLNGVNLDNAAGFETDLEFNIATTSLTTSLDETQAGVRKLTYNSGSLRGWEIGGNENGTAAILFDAGQVFDFYLYENPYYPFFNITGTGRVRGDIVQWSVSEISAVPLPAAVWAFGAGLLALFGVKRRRKATAALAA